MCITVVSRKNAPPFATLALVQTAGGAYTRDATFSLAITPSLDREMFSGSVDAGFVLVLPFHHGELEPDCQVGVSTKEGSEGGAYIARRRDALNASGRLASFSVDGKSGWRVHRCCRRSAFAVDNLTVDSRVA